MSSTLHFSLGSFTKVCDSEQKEVFDYDSSMPEFFDFIDNRAPEEQNVVIVEATTLWKNEKLIASCEHSNPEDAELPFDNIIDRGTPELIVDSVAGDRLIAAATP